MTIKPLITEKSMYDARKQWYTFLVDLKETKNTIARKVSALYGVDVVSVRTSIRKGKTRRAGRKMRPVFLSDVKKAIVELKDGQTIDAFQIGEQPVPGKTTV